jgi:hypothetical protein
MRRHILRIFFVGAGFLLAGPTLADEIIYFTNGTAMGIRTHRIDKGMIYVELGTNSTLAFPAASVEKIEQAGRQVYGGGTANQAVAGAPGSGGPQASAPMHTNPARYRGTSQSERRRQMMDPMDQLEAARSGAIATPVAGSSSSPVGSRLQSANGSDRPAGASRPATGGRPPRVPDGGEPEPDSDRRDVAEGTADASIGRRRGRSARAGRSAAGR